jgi:hypothetical protein
MSLCRRDKEGKFGNYFIVMVGDEEEKEKKCLMFDD